MFERIPRVVPAFAGQPWAAGRHPFGIEREDTCSKTDMRTEGRRSFCEQARLLPLLLCFNGARQLRSPDSQLKTLSDGRKRHSISKLDFPATGVGSCSATRTACSRG